MPDLLRRRAVRRRILRLLPAATSAKSQPWAKYVFRGNKKCTAVRLPGNSTLFIFMISIHVRPVMSNNVTVHGLTGREL